MVRIAEAALALVAGFAVSRCAQKNHPGDGSILSNMSANLLGLGNAATPMGIKAMQQLQELNPDKQTASPAMCTLLALNTASITIIPTTLIAICLNYHSANATEIVETTLMATIIATLAAIIWLIAELKKGFTETAAHKQKSGIPA